MARATTAGPPPSVAMEPARPTDERTVHSRDFSWFWQAYTVSIIGDQVTLLALPVAVFARTQSALSVGIAASMQAGGRGQPLD